MTKENLKYYKTLFICCCLIASSIGICMNSSGVFYHVIAESYGLSQGSVSFSGTLLMISSALTSLFIPNILHHISLKKMICYASFTGFFSTILIPICSNTAAFYIFSAIRGCSTSFFSAVPITILMNYWYHQHYGLFTSLVLGCSGIASAIASPIFVNLIHSIGWQTTYICMGLLQLSLCLPAMLYKFTLTPQEQDLCAYGENKDEQTKTSLYIEDHSFSKRRILAFLLFASFVTAITGVCQQFTSVCEQTQMPYTVTAFVMSAVMLGNISFKFLLGFLSDRFGAISSSAGMIMINVFATVLLVFVQTPMITLLATYLFGSIYSISAVGIVLLIKEIFGENNYSRLYPLISFVSNIAMAFAISFTGMLYDMTGTYQSMFFMVILLQCFNIVYLGWKKIHILSSLPKLKTCNHN